MLFLRGKSTAVTEKEGTQLKDERGVVDVEDHVPGAPTKVRHSSTLDSQLPATHTTGLFR